MAHSAAYLADTNVYVTAANDDTIRREFARFIERHGPLLVSSVVLAEVVIGIANAASREGAVHAVSAGTVVVAPSADDWTRAGMAVAQLGGEAVTKSRSFWNDAILAAQCARLGVTLLTHNAKDFQRLGRHLGVHAVAPFPAR
jgi:predicted nucleic acid-binding protein